MIQRRVFARGRVQGVSFRVSTAEAARRVDPALRGWVRNLADGRVEAVFQGTDDSVLEMVAWCRRGPAGAEVLELEVREEDPDPALAAFQIKKNAP
jgi:acylphosphatase